jgi:hypothetical protein
MGSDDVTRGEVERRLGRSFDDVQGHLIELFDLEWEEIEVVIETSATKAERSRADVIVGLVEKAETKPPISRRVRRGVIRWIGKPWREREDPWERFKHRVPQAPPRTDTQADDLEEWTPLRPEQEE